MLQKRLIGEVVRNLGLAGQIQKQGTPTMGGIIIILAVIVPTLLLAQITNVYIWTILLSTIWLGLIGFIDDYIKVIKKNKDGLAGKFKVMGQIGLGLIVGSVLYFHPDVQIRESVRLDKIEVFKKENPEAIIVEKKNDNGKVISYIADHKSTKTSVPFLKEAELDYGIFINWLGKGDLSWLIYIPFVILIITAVSNGVNMTDGLDGLAAGTSSIVVLVLGLFAYVSGNTIFANYLNIMYIPNLGEMLIFSTALMGACIGFLWWNNYPAQVFMGDTGSLTLGGLIAVMGLMVRKELLLPVLCGVFLIENLSVILQVGWFKYTKKKYGEGRRLFRMAPIHHHFQKKEMHEAKIVGRFWIFQIFLAILTIITLKIR
jgi:phospho-N-acetylmuramoyl-pentapeptide-transferase